MLKAFSSGFFGCVEKRLNSKTMVDFKIYDLTGWVKNYY